MNKELLVLAFKRAVWTFLQVVLSMITVGAAVQDIDWLSIVSIAATAFIYSFIKSIVIGVPEAIKDGTILVDDTQEDSTKWFFQFSDKVDPSDLNNKKSLRFEIKKNESGAG